MFSRSTNIQRVIVELSDSLLPFLSLFEGNGGYGEEVEGLSSSITSRVKIFKIHSVTLQNFTVTKKFLTFNFLNIVIICITKNKNSKKTFLSFSDLKVKKIPNPLSWI